MTQPSAWDIGEKKKLLIFQRSFHEHTLRMRVVLSQLPLSVCVCLSAILVWLFFPATLENPLFLIFLLSQAFLLALCIVVPWHRLPFASFLTIPILDMVSIAFGREGGQEALTGLSVLVVLPVIWLCASGLYPRLAIVMSFLGPLGIVWVPVFLHNEVSEQALTKPLLFPILILGIGVSVSVLTLSMVRQQRVLEQKDEALKEALGISTKQERLLNTVMEALPLGVVAVDGDGHDILMNRRQRQTHALATPPDNDDPNESQLLVFDIDRSTPLPPDHAAGAARRPGRTLHRPAGLAGYRRGTAGLHHQRPSHAGRRREVRGLCGGLQ